MIWTQDRPSRSGIYLRSTVQGRIAQQDVVDADGELVTIIAGAVKKVRELRPEFWWLGPLPPLPSSAKELKR